MITTRQQKKFSLGEFELEPEKRLLTRNGMPVRLARRPFQVLLYLVEHRGRIVSRNELLEKFWEGRDVYEVALSKCIGAIRKALGDKLHEPRFIETRWAEGYRYIGEFEQNQTEATNKNGAKTSDINFLIETTLQPNISGTNDISAAPNDSVTEIQPLSITENLSSSVSKPNKTQSILFIGGFCLLIAAIAITILWFYWGRPTPSKNQSASIRSVAVLPLKNLTGDDEQDFLADGITESLISSLSKIDGLKVTSRGSVFSFKDKEVDPKEVGKQLNVEAILEGSVRRDGEAVRVEVRLVSTKDGSVLWSGETYERPLKNIIALETDVSRGIVTKLKGDLNREENKKFTRRHTENEEAYQLYLKGRSFWNERRLKKAIEHFEKAVALDTDYALAYAGLADSYVLLSPNAFGKPNEAFPKAKDAALKALSLDPELAEAHTTLAKIAWLYEWNGNKAEAGLNQAIKLNPNYATAHHWRAFFLSSLGRHSEALESIKLAGELDPFSVPISNDTARVYYHARQYDLAIEQGLKTLELEPRNITYNSWLDMAYSQKGDYEKAVELRLRFFANRKIEEEKITALKKAFEKDGWKGYCREELNQSLQRQKQGSYVLSYNIARSYARLDENEQTLHWLEKAYEEHSDHLTLLKVDPLFDSLRTDSRFQDLLKRVGF